MPAGPQQAADAQHTDPLSALQGNPDPTLTSNLSQPAAQPSLRHETDATPSAHLEGAQKPLQDAANQSAQRQPDDGLQHAQQEASTSGQADLQVRFADVGCGFGGLLVRLSPLYPDRLMVGMEIRDKVSLPHQNLFHDITHAGQCRHV